MRSVAGPGRLIVRLALPPVVLVAALLLALAFGSVSISPLEIGRILFLQSHLCVGHGTWASGSGAIICEVRLPDVVAAAAVGVSLALAGALFQAVLRNPLADPYVIGTSAGAQLGITLVFVLPIQLSVWGFGTTQIAAFAGALGTVLFVYAVARVGGRTPVVTLILAGFVISSFLISATTLLTYAGSGVGDRLTRLIGWTLGGLEVESWGQLGVAIPCILVAAAISYLLAPRLDLILIGEDQASHLGVRVERLKLVAIILASFLTALAVTLAGIVAFVGLVVPHAMRLIYGPGHRRLLPTTALAGAAFVVVCDLIARVVVAPSVLPLGVVTAVVGAPFFLHLLRRSRREYIV